MEQEKTKYPCENCNKTYTHQRSLQRHIKKFHTKWSTNNAKTSVKDFNEQTVLPEDIFDSSTMLKNYNKTVYTEKNISMQNTEMATTILEHFWDEAIPSFLPTVERTIIEEARRCHQQNLQMLQIMKKLFTAIIKPSQQTFYTPPSYQVVYDYVDDIYNNINHEKWYEIMTLLAFCGELINSEKIKSNVPVQFANMIAKYTLQKYARWVEQNGTWRQFLFLVDKYRIENNV